MQFKSNNVKRLRTVSNENESKSRQKKLDRFSTSTSNLRQIRGESANLTAYFFLTELTAQRSAVKRCTV